MFFSFFAAGIVGTTAFLQAQTAAWKGLVGAGILFVLGAAIALFLQPNFSENAENFPPFGVTASLAFGASMVAVGSILALALRSRLSEGRIAIAAFIGSWVLLQILVLAF